MKNFSFLIIIASMAFLLAGCPPKETPDPEPDPDPPCVGADCEDAPPAPPEDEKEDPPPPPEDEPEIIE